MRGIMFISCGLIAGTVSLFYLNDAIVAALTYPLRQGSAFALGQGRGSRSTVIDAVAQHRTRQRGPRVVAIGGGTGMSRLLQGLRDLSCDLSVVVTVADDGGSSGRLRRELSILPPGDFRQCIAALADVEPLMAQLLQYRFPRGGGLEGHSFGNLFLAALTAVTSDFSEAVRLSSEILLTRGHIYPATTSHVELEALMEDGTRVRGETRITASSGRIQQLFLDPPDVKPLPQMLEAMARADLITVGPGSLFTSLIPNVLVPGIAQAMVNSAAVKVYVGNLMTQANESLGLTAADHIRALNRHAGVKRIFDFALINRTPAPPPMKAKYALEGANQIVADLEAIEELGVIPVLGDYLDDKDMVARHLTDRIATDLMDLVTHGGSRTATP